MIGIVLNIIGFFIGSDLIQEHCKINMTLQQNFDELNWRLPSKQALVFFAL